MATAVLEPQTADSSLAHKMPAQSAWAELPLKARLRILRAAEGALAAAHASLVDALPTHARTRADSYASELLPLLAACRFLLRSAERILKPRSLGRRGLPFWLSGIDTVIHRVPLGTVLVIGPANYPLFLPGVQTLQALAAGNAVVWKPGQGGRAVAEVFAATLAQAGLPGGLLRVTDESSESAQDEIRAGVAKIIFTGSASAGRSVLKLAAQTATPVIAELSGCDAVIVLPSAEPGLVVDALCFGMRLNGSATCMAPRRLLLVGPGHQPLLESLQQRFAAMDAVQLPPRVSDQVRDLLLDAKTNGATILGQIDADTLKPLLILNARPEMRIAQADVFAPLLPVIQVADAAEAIAADAYCPFGLTAAIFGEVSQAQALGARLEVGTVLINDLIVPTADPRISFSGRRGSGFGATRGAEGLLEMTAVKTAAVRRSRSHRQYQPTEDAQEALFAAVASMSYGATIRTRAAGLRNMLAAAKQIKNDEAAREKQ